MREAGGGERADAVLTASGGDDLPVGDPVCVQARGLIRIAACAAHRVTTPRQSESSPFPVWRGVHHCQFCSPWWVNLRRQCPYLFSQGGARPVAIPPSRDDRRHPSYSRRFPAMVSLPTACGVVIYFTRDDLTAMLDPWSRFPGQFRSPIPAPMPPARSTRPLMPPTARPAKFSTPGIATRPLTKTSNQLSACATPRPRRRGTADYCHGDTDVEPLRQLHYRA